jgi:hypothetical protein
MSKQFKGQVVDNQGNKLEGVKIVITGNNVPSNTSTTTDSEGKWLVTLENDVNSTDVSITFSKSGLETKNITNPQPTSELEGYIDPEKGGILDLAGKYPSGKWKISSLPQETQDIINKEIEDTYTFIKNNPNNFRLEIESSESQVPNTDNEDTNKNFSTPGSLAEARAQELEKYVNDKINTLYIAEANPTFQKPIAILGNINRVGDIVWDGVNTDSDKYTKDQYTRLKANLIGKTPEPTPIPTPAPVSVDYTYLGRLEEDTIYVDVRNNLRLIGERKFSTVTYTVDSAVATMKNEGEKFGFSFDGILHPPQNPTQST